MKDDPILDDDFIREVLLQELGIDLTQTEPAPILDETSDTALLKTLANPHKTALLSYILTKAGIANNTKSVNFSGALDPFASPTQQLFVGTQDLDKALEIVQVIDSLDNDPSDHLPDEEFNEKSSGINEVMFTIAILIAAGFVILLVYLLFLG